MARKRVAVVWKGWHGWVGYDAVPHLCQGPWERLSPQRWPVRAGAGHRAQGQCWGAGVGRARMLFWDQGRWSGLAHARAPMLPSASTPHWWLWREGRTLSLFRTFPEDHMGASLVCQVGRKSVNRSRLALPAANWRTGQSLQTVSALASPPEAEGVLRQVRALQGHGSRRWGPHGGASSPGLPLQAEDSQGAISPI